MGTSMEGRNVVVFGVANKRSIAWAIAQHMQQAGARLAITYQNERLKQEADDLIAALPNAQAFQCDVSSDPEIAKLFGELKAKFGKLDAVVHSVAYAPAEALKESSCKRAAKPSALHSIPVPIRWWLWPGQQLR